MAKNLLKYCWNTSPQLLRLLFLSGLCLLRAQRRSVALTDAGPLFVCGAFYSSSGFAQGARLYIEACRGGAREVLPVDITAPMRQCRNFFPEEIPLTITQARKVNGCGTVVIHANPPQSQLALCALGKDFLRGKRIVAIGLGSWKPYRLSGVRRFSMWTQWKCPAALYGRHYNNVRASRAVRCPIRLSGQRATRRFLQRAGSCDASIFLMPPPHMNAKILWPF